jgi:hypothetical protein
VHFRRACSQMPWGDVSSMEFTEDTHREMARKANARVWELLEATVRSQGENDELLEAAYTSLFHWRFGGAEPHRARGLWSVAHAHTVLGDGPQAMKYARSCFEWTTEHRHVMEDFDVAYAHEGLARAMALAGQPEAARRQLGLALEAGERISDPEDKSIFMGDLEAGDRYGIR